MLGCGGVGSILAALYGGLAELRMMQPIVLRPATRVPNRTPYYGGKAYSVYLQKLRFCQAAMEHRQAYCRSLALRRTLLSLLHVAPRVLYYGRYIFTTLNPLAGEIRLTELFWLRGMPGSRESTPRDVVQDQPIIAWHTQRHDRVDHAQRDCKYTPR